MGAKLEAVIAVLNGMVGDYLARTANGLATEMTLVHAGAPLALDREALARALPGASSRVVVLVHGLMCTEQIWRFPDGSDYGSRLACDLGYTPLYLRYNSGRAIADSGAELDRLLDALMPVYPTAIDEILLLGYSMGGLVVRSATHAASLGRHRWLDRVRRAVYVGTPHLGAPLERAGRVLARTLRAIDDPYTRFAATLGDLRSDGIQDLGDADLRHEDRARRRPHFSLRDPRHPVPLLDGIRHHLVAGSLARHPRLAVVLGDAMVPLPSGTDGACVDPDSIALAPEHVRVLAGVGHVALARHPEVYAQIRAWCDEPIADGLDRTDRTD